MARKYESVTGEGAMPGVECAVSFWALEISEERLSVAIFIRKVFVDYQGSSDEHVPRPHI